jgi:molybdopterin-containing oxidoreductase family membrane subunit
MFVLEALLSGGALIAILTFFFDPDRGSVEHKDLVKFLGRIVLGLLCLYVLFFLSEVLVAIYGKIPSHIESYKFIFSGQYAPFFWIGQVLMVVVIPFFILAFKGKSALAIGVASSLIVLGFIFVKLNLVVPAGIVPEFAGLRTAYTDSHLTFTYFPSLMEWLLELWILSIGMFLFLSGRKLLRLFKAS